MAIMSNWAERAEAERQRIAREQEEARQRLLADQAANEAVERLAAAKEARKIEAAARVRASQEKEITRERERQERILAETIKGKLAIYDQLGIPEMLEEIKRDIWQDNGKIKREEQIDLSQASGSVGHRLAHNAVIEVNPEWETFIKRVYGPVTEYTYSIDGPRYSHTTNKIHDETNYRLVGASEHPKDYSISAKLQYSLGSNTYNLTVAGQFLAFPEEDIDLGTLRDFADKAFLQHAVNPGIPDFSAMQGHVINKTRAIRRYVGRNRKSIPVNFDRPASDFPSSSRGFGPFGIFKGP